MQKSKRVVERQEKGKKKRINTYGDMEMGGAWRMSLKGPHFYLKQSWE